jgi:hypothetical protein
MSTALENVASSFKQSSTDPKSKKLLNGCGQGLSKTAQKPVQTPIRSIRFNLVERDHLRGQLGVIWGSFDLPSVDMTSSVTRKVVV